MDERIERIWLKSCEMRGVSPEDGILKIQTAIFPDKKSVIIDWNLISPIEEQMLKTTYLAGFVDGANYVKTRTQHTIANDIKS